MGSLMFDLIQGDARDLDIESESVDCVITSPPYYGLRNYFDNDQIGNEHTPEGYILNLISAFREVWRVLKPGGTAWLNLGDTYAPGSIDVGGFDVQRKDLIGIPWRVAFSLQADGWILRQDIVWHKPNPTPESARDRCTRAHEFLFLLVKGCDYYFDADAIRTPYVRDWGQSNGSVGKSGYQENTTQTGGAPVSRGPTKKGANKRSVWSISAEPYKGAHFAVMPPGLVEPCILAGCPAGGVVLDPFAGSGTVGSVAIKHGREFIGVDLNREFLALASERLTRALSDAGRAHPGVKTGSGSVQFGLFAKEE